MKKINWALIKINGESKKAEELNFMDEFVIIEDIKNEIKKVIEDLPEIETEGGKLVSCNKLYLKSAFGVE